MKPNYRFLITSPSCFVSGSEGNELKVLHAFEDIFNYESFSGARWDHSHHIVEFYIEPEPLQAGMMLPNYYPVGEIVSQVMTVLYGKLCVPVGFLESQGTNCIPEFKTMSVFNKKKAFYSDELRPEFEIKLDRRHLDYLDISKVNDNDFLIASRIYQNALIDYPTNLNIAYMELVNAGEILTRNMGFENGSYDEETVRVLEKIRDEIDEGEYIASFLKGKLKQLKKKYVLGLLSLCDESLYIKNPLVLHGQLDPSNIQAALSASYILRSKILHEGMRIGSLVNFRHSEIGLPHRSGDDSSFVRTLNKAPTFDCLERIIRFCLLKRMFQLFGKDISQARSNPDFKLVSLEKK